VQPGQKRALVVDDEPTIRELIADALRESDIQVEIASNGVEALAVMHRWLPDVVVLDLMMPRLDGTGFTELMRLNPQFANVPLLLVTAAYGAQQAAAQVGARAWLSKPFELDHLVAEVTRLAGAPVQVASDPISDGHLGNVRPAVNE
jgi:two-component system chemotaxis response regulator CheY